MSPSLTGARFSLDATAAARPFHAWSRRQRIHRNHQPDKTDGLVAAKRIRRIRLLIPLVGFHVSECTQSLECLGITLTVAKALVDEAAEPSKNLDETIGFSRLACVQVDRLVGIRC